MVALLNNSTILSTLVVVIASLGGISLLIFGIFQMRRTSEIVDQRMQIYIRNRDKKSRLRNIMYRFTPRELSGSFYNRTIKPFFQKIVNYFGRFTPSNTIAKTDLDLRAAGNPYGMHARQFYGMRVMLLFTGIIPAFFIFSRNGISNFSTFMLGIFILIFI